jgi:hypothetical protein
MVTYSFSFYCSYDIIFVSSMRNSAAAGAGAAAAKLICKSKIHVLS